MSLPVARAPRCRLPRRLAAGLLAAAAGLAGCHKDAGAPATTAEPAMHAAEGPMLVVADTTLRLAPSDDEAVPHPRDPQRALNNFVGIISRGKLVSVRRSLPGWHEVVLEDDAEGWLHAAALVPARGLTEATVTAPTAALSAPAPGAPGVAQVGPGDLLFVVEAGDPYARVHIGDGGLAYVASRDLVESDTELAMSHLIGQAKMARRMNDADGASDVLAEARRRYPDSALLQTLAEQADFFTRRAADGLHNSRLHPLPRAAAPVPPGPPPGPPRPM